GALVQLTEGNVRVVFEVVHRVDVLQIHGDAPETIGELTAHWFAVEAAGLLKVSELANLEAVEPNLPAEAPGAERWAFPVILDETHVVIEGLGSDRLE